MPRIKFLVAIFGIAAASAVGWRFFAIPAEHTASYAAPRLAADYQEQQVDLQKDSDGDGLEDWEEIIWDTNPYTADTDGDGVTDDVEVEERKKTAVTLPKSSKNYSVRDTIAQTFPYGSSDATANINASKRAAEEYVAAYMEQKYNENPAGGQVDAAYLSGEFLSAMKRVITERSARPPATYIEPYDLTVVSDTSADRMRRYFNEMGAMILSSDASLTPSFEIIDKVVGTLESEGPVDYQKLYQLRDHSLLYLSHATRMRDMEVPEHIADAHADMINSFLRMSVILEDVMRLEGDPLTGFAAANEYVIEMQRSTSAVRPLIAELKNQELYFEANEGGSVFAQFASNL